jgi:hypothetical protein
MSIRTIEKNIGTVATWGDPDFDVNVQENYTSLKEIVPMINNSIEDINSVISSINTTEKNTLTYKQNAKDSQDAAQVSALAAQNSANTATQKAIEIEGFQFPTGVTYTPTEVDNKIEEKALESFLGFNF